MERGILELRQVAVMVEAHIGLEDEHFLCFSLSSLACLMGGTFLLSILEMVAKRAV